MKNQIITAICGILFLSFHSLEAKEITVTRDFKESFAISENDILNIETNFTSITIEEWDNDKIEFQATARCWGKDTNTANKQLDRITVKFSKTNNQINANTELKPTNVTSNGGMDIKMRIFVPKKKIFVKIKSRHGHVKMGTVRGDLTADVQFGNVNVDRVMGIDNRVDVRHGDFSCEDIPSLDLKIQFGKSRIGKAGDMSMNSQHSTHNLGDINSLRLNSKFDKFEITSLADMNASMAHSTFDIKNVRKTLIITELKFGGLKVNQLSADFDKVEVNSEHSNINISVAKGYSFRFDFKTQHGKINTDSFGDDTSSYYRNKEHFTDEFRGIAGNLKNPTSEMKISNKFGEINIRNK